MAYGGGKVEIRYGSSSLDYNHPIEKLKLHKNNMRPRDSMFASPRYGVFNNENLSFYEHEGRCVIEASTTDTDRGDCPNPIFIWDDGAERISIVLYNIAFRYSMCMCVMLPRTQ
jgi:hypothetical protein